MDLHRSGWPADAAPNSRPTLAPGGQQQAQQLSPGIAGGTHDGGDQTHAAELYRTMNRPSIVTAGTRRRASGRAGPPPWRSAASATASSRTAATSSGVNVRSGARRRSANASDRCPSRPARPVDVEEAHRLHERPLRHAAGRPRHRRTGRPRSTTRARSSLATGNVENLGAAYDLLVGAEQVELELHDAGALREAEGVDDVRVQLAGMTDHPSVDAQRGAAAGVPWRVGVRCHGQRRRRTSRRRRARRRPRHPRWRRARRPTSRSARARR